MVVVQIPAAIAYLFSVAAIMLLVLIGVFIYYVITIVRAASHLVQRISQEYERWSHHLRRWRHRFFHRL